MNVILLDANAVIMHGRAFSGRVHTAFEAGNTIVLPQSVKQELVDDVLDNNDAPANHRASAQSVQALSDDGSLIGEFVSVDDFGHREVLLDRLDFNG
jgi:hypothetical protein